MSYQVQSQEWPRTHPIFQVSCLNPYHDDLVDDYRSIPTCGNTKLMKEKWILEGILVERMVDQGKAQVCEFLIKWKGLPYLWELEEILQPYVDKVKKMLEARGWWECRLDWARENVMQPCMAVEALGLSHVSDIKNFICYIGSVLLVNLLPELQPATKKRRLAWRSVAFHCFLCTWHFARVVAWVQAFVLFLPMCRLFSSCSLGMTFSHFVFLACSSCNLCTFAIVIQ